MRTDLYIKKDGNNVFLYMETNKLHCETKAFNILKKEYKNKTEKDIVNFSDFGHFKMQKNSDRCIIKMMVHENRI